MLAQGLTLDELVYSGGEVKRRPQPGGGERWKGGGERSQTEEEKTGGCRRGGGVSLRASPLSPTLERDGGNDAAAAAAVVAARPAPSLLGGRRLPGTVLPLLAEARRVDHQAQLCIA